MEERERHHHDVTGRVTGWRGEVLPLARLATPLVGAQLASVAMGATDAAFLGSLGTAAMGGGGLAASIHVTVQLVASGFLTIVAPLAADARARRDDHALSTLVRHALGAALVLGLAGAVVVQNVGWVLAMLGEPVAVVDAVDPFARMVAWSTPFALTATVFRHVLTASGRARIIGIATVGAAIANFVLDALLVDRLGAAGVGLATTLVTAAMSIVLAIAALRATEPRSIFRGGFDRNLLRELLRLGTPAAFMVGAEVAVFQLAGLVVATFGTIALAAHQIGLAVVTVTFVIPLGISQAVAIRVAQANVRGGPSDSRRAGAAGVSVGVAVALGSAAVLLVAPQAIVRIFVRDDAPTIELASNILRLAALFQVFDGVQVIAAGALRGLRDTRTPAAFAVTGYLAVAPAVGWLAAKHMKLGVLGIWLGLAAALAFVSVSLLIRFVRLTRIGPTTSTARHDDVASRSAST